MQEPLPALRHTPPMPTSPELTTAPSQDASDPMAAAPLQSVWVHLEELRRRLWVCIAAVAAGTMVSFHWVDQVIVWLKQPAGAALPRLAFFGPAEAFPAHLQASVPSRISLA